MAQQTTAGTLTRQNGTSVLGTIRQQATMERGTMGLSLQFAPSAVDVQSSQLTAPLANKHQETTPCVVVVLVRLEVRRQVFDPFREDRDLDFRGACIGGVDAILPDQCRLVLVGQQPASSVFLCLTYEHQPT